MGAAAVAFQGDRTTINPLTGLAGDYLNHFHEIYLILRFVADEPSLLDDLQDWQPRNYLSHFQQSPLLDRDDVITAYNSVPPVTRQRFDELCEEAGRVIELGLRALIAAGATEGASLGPAADSLADEVKSYLDRLDAIIHGRGVRTISPTATMHEMAAYQ